MRAITINAVLNGWTVKVGCQTLVYTEAENLAKDLLDYMCHPETKEKEVLASAVNKYLLNRGECGEQIQVSLAPAEKVLADIDRQLRRGEVVSAERVATDLLTRGKL